MSLIKLIQLNSHGDERGKLISLEGNKNIPFHIKRVYYIFDTLTDVRRGFHAHKALEQILICIHGSCKIMLDDGGKQEVTTLSSPDQGLYIGSMLWREMFDFSKECVLMVLASEHYNEDDYIRNYQQFLKLIKLKSKHGEKTTPLGVSNLMSLNRI